MRRAIGAAVFGLLLVAPVHAGAKVAPRVTVKAVRQDTRVRIHGRAPGRAHVQWMIVTGSNDAFGVEKAGKAAVKRGRYKATAELPWSAPNVPATPLRVVIAAGGEILADTDVTAYRV